MTICNERFTIAAYNALGSIGQFVRISQSLNWTKRFTRFNEWITHIWHCEAIFLCRKEKVHLLNQKSKSLLFLEMIVQRLHWEKLLNIAGWVFIPVFLSQLPKRDRIKIILNHLNKLRINKSNKNDNKHGISFMNVVERKRERKKGQTKLTYNLCWKSSITCKLHLMPLKEHSMNFTFIRFFFRILPCIWSFLYLNFRYVPICFVWNVFGCMHIFPMLSSAPFLYNQHLAIRFETVCNAAKVSMLILHAIHFIFHRMEEKQQRKMWHKPQTYIYLSNAAKKGTLK